MGRGEEGFSEYSNSRRILTHGVLKGVPFQMGRVFPRKPFSPARPGPRTVSRSLTRE